MTQNYFDAEDLAQDTFLAFYKALPEFDGENPGGFLTRIATNKCLDYLKRAERRTVVAEDDQKSFCWKRKYSHYWKRHV